MLLRVDPRNETGRENDDPAAGLEGTHSKTVNLLKKSKAMRIGGVALYEATGICGSAKNSLVRLTIKALAR